MGSSFLSCESTVSTAEVRSAHSFAGHTSVMMRKTAYFRTGLLVYRLYLREVIVAP